MRKRAHCLNRGAITDPTLDLFYPSIAVNTNGTIVVGFNGSSVGSFVGCYAVVGETVNGSTYFDAMMLLKAGVVSYQNTDSSGYSRWGDYSATSVDPTDPTKFWTIQMYPSTAGAWSTQITQILTTQVQLAIAKVGTNVMVSWPNLAASFQLQASSDVSDPLGWINVTDVPQLNGQLLYVQLPIMSGQQQFFRLIGLTQ